MSRTSNRAAPLSQSRGSQEHPWLLLHPESLSLCPTALSCPPPPAIPQGQHSGNSSGEFVFGSVTTYRCEPGLELLGQDTLLCGDNGTWTGALPSCGELVPSQPSPPLHVIIAPNPILSAQEFCRVCPQGSSSALQGARSKTRLGFYIFLSEERAEM